MDHAINTYLLVKIGTNQKYLENCFSVCAILNLDPDAQTKIIHTPVYFLFLIL